MADFARIMSVTGNHQAVVAFESFADNKAKVDSQVGHLIGGLVDFPEELMEIVLSFCDLASIPAVRQVCQTWNQIVKNPSFWKLIMLRERRTESFDIIRTHLSRNISDGWQVYLSELTTKFISRNLVKNACGEDGFDAWEVMSGESDGWTTMTKPDVDCKRPPYTNSAFVSGFYSSSKEQVVDLWSEGFNPAVMRACVPFSITWSEWLCTGTHSGVYECKVNFIGSDMCQISPFSPYEHYRRIFIDRNTNWHKISHEFRVTEANAFEVIHDLRYFHIYHGAMAVFGVRGEPGPMVTNTKLEIKFLPPQ